MLPKIESIKGIHPGQALERILKEKGIKKSAFAMQIGEYPAIISEICRMKRGVSASLSIKFEDYLNTEEGYFMVLQAYYETKMARQKISTGAPKPDMEIIRKSLFWDIDLTKLDFQLRKRFVIKRVFERGNDQEIGEIISFYGLNDCKYILKSSRSLLHTAVNNAQRHLNLNQKDLHQCRILEP